VIQSALLDDPEAKDLELVIVEDPVESVKKNKFLHAPVMLGSTRDEGSLVIGGLFETIEISLNHYLLIFIDNVQYYLLFSLSSLL